MMWLYLDCELTHRRRHAIAAHLLTCVGCRTLFDFNRAFLNTVRFTMRRGVTIDPSE